MKRILVSMVFILLAAMAFVAFTAQFPSFTSLFARKVIVKDSLRVGKTSIFNGAATFNAGVVGVAGLADTTGIRNHSNVLYAPKISPTMTGTATVAKFANSTTSTTVDSFKVTSDTLRFYIGGVQYVAAKR